jgi:sulfatase modifying factor 1
MLLILAIVSTFSSRLDAQDVGIETEPRSVKDATPDSDQVYRRFKGEQAGQKRDDNGMKLPFVWIRPGAFVMGDYDDADVTTDSEGKPKPDVTAPVKALLTRGLWLGSHEITQSQWTQLMHTQPWRNQNRIREGADYPACYINYHDATAFCSKLTELERTANRITAELMYALPTEALWERACRAGTETRYHFGKDERLRNDYAWNLHNAINVGEAHPHRVGQKKPNSWGLSDMHGNVWEWCRDAHDYDLTGGKDPEGFAIPRRAATAHRTLRGGCFHEQEPRCRSGMRSAGEPDYRGAHIGFRVSLRLVPKGSE